MDGTCPAKLSHLLACLLSFLSFYRPCFLLGALRLCSWASCTPIAKGRGLTTPCCSVWASLAHCCTVYNVCGRASHAPVCGRASHTAALFIMCVGTPHTASGRSWRGTCWPMAPRRRLRWPKARFQTSRGLAGRRRPRPELARRRQRPAAAPAAAPAATVCRRRCRRRCRCPPPLPLPLPHQLPPRWGRRWQRVAAAARRRCRCRRRRPPLPPQAPPIVPRRPAPPQPADTRAAAREHVLLAVPQQARGTRNRQPHAPRRAAATAPAAGAHARSAAHATLERRCYEPRRAFDARVKASL